MSNEICLLEMSPAINTINLDGAKILMRENEDEDPHVHVDFKGNWDSRYFFGSGWKNIDKELRNATKTFKKVTLYLEMMEDYYVELYNKKINDWKKTKKETADKEKENLKKALVKKKKIIGD